MAKKNYTVFAGVRAKKDGTVLTQLHPNIIPVILDVSVDSSITAAYKTITKELAKKKLELVGLLNNAGIAKVSKSHLCKNTNKRKDDTGNGAR